MSRAAAASIAVLLSTVFAATAAAAAASAVTSDDAAVTWSVQPASAEGPDGRSWIEQTLDPGQRVVEHLALRNLGGTDVTFAIKAADGYLTPTGRFNMLPSDTPSVDAGTWVDAPETVQVGAGETQVVEFTITVPENATPGDHAAGIAATVQSVGAGADGNQISIESRVGFPIMTRVTGELDPSMGIEPLRVEYRMSWNPFQPGEVVAVYELVNNGNVRLQTIPVVESQGRVATADPEASALEVLPGDRREVTATVPGVWPLFYAPVEVRIAPTIVTPNGEPQVAEAVVRDFGVWAIPLPQLLVLLGLVLIVLALVLGRRRSKRRVEAMIAEAREAGRQERAQP